MFKIDELIVKAIKSFATIENFVIKNMFFDLLYKAISTKGTATLFNYIDIIKEYIETVNTI